MADQYERDNHGGSGASFLLGLLTGAVLGAGIGILLAPKTGSDLRDQLGEQARDFGNRASEQYRRASETAGHWAERGREAVNQARSAVQRGVEAAKEVPGSAPSGNDSSRS